jgi:hypothetical protein
MGLDRVGSRGVGLALLAALLFGASAPAAKGLLPGTAPQLLAGLLYGGSGGGLLLYWLGRRQARDGLETPLGRPDLPWLAGAILAGGVVAPLLLMLGLTRTPASAASRPCPDHHAEGACGGRNQHRAGLAPRRPVPGGYRADRGTDRRTAELRREPRPLRPGTTRARDRSHGRLLLSCAIHRSRYCRRGVARAYVAVVRPRRAPNGIGTPATSHRAA